MHARAVPARGVLVGGCAADRLDAGVEVRVEKSGSASRSRPLVLDARDAACCGRGRAQERGSGTKLPLRRRKAAAGDRPLLADSRCLRTDSCNEAYRGRGGSSNSFSPSMLVTAIQRLPSFTPPSLDRWPRPDTSATLVANIEQHGFGRFGSVTTVARVEMIRDRYSDFGPTLAREKLIERHGVTLGRETVRRLMVAAGL